MKRKGIYALSSCFIVVVALTLLITLGVFSDPTSKGDPEVSTPEVPSAPLVVSPTVTPAAPEPASPPGSPQESIKVHGHWMIEVRNPDGSLVEQREFDNALLATGAETLVKVMAGDAEVGGWTIILAGDPTPFPIPATIVEDFYPESQPYGFKTLIVDGTGLTALVLTGNATATTNGNINYVRTDVGLKPAARPLEEYGSNWMFTQTTFDPVNLTEGQQVLITVEISFSS